MTDDAAQPTYRMPAEWEPHEAVWLQWPLKEMRPLPNYARKLQSTWLEMTVVMADHVNVRIAAGSEADAERIEADCRHFGANMSRVEVFSIPIDDVWARDNGPIFVKDGEGALVVTDWNFNGWGGDSPHTERDAAVSAAIAERYNLRREVGEIVTEGGAVEVNGSGSFLATRSSIINPNRNPGKSQAEVEADLTRLLGVTHFIWLTGASPEECYSLGDGTDYHIDIAARFVDRNTVLVNTTQDEADPRKPFMERHIEELKASTDETGRPLTIVEIPTPHMLSVNPVNLGVLDRPAGQITDAAYSNYLVTNGLLLMPAYGLPSDNDAKAILAEHFPGREIVGISTVTLTEEGGAIHCVTQQQPA